MSKPVGDGNHLLESGAILTVTGGVPISVEMRPGADVRDLSIEIERVTNVWIETVEGDMDEDDEPIECSAAGSRDLPLGAIPIRILEMQPTHIFTDDRDGARLVRIVEEFGETMALGRACFDEGESDEWSPWLRDGVWLDSWDDEPLPGARVEPLASEAQA